MDNNHKIAIVIHRIGREIVGGAESYAFKLATILSERARVDILSTCAKDHLSWENEYSEGKEKVAKNLKIIRFRNTLTRNEYWDKLNRYILFYPEYDDSSNEEKEKIRNIVSNIPVRVAEEWMKYQGPYSPDLYKYLRKNESKYKKIIFFTYLYPTTFFGVDQIINQKKIFLVPTFHDEVRAFLPIISKYRTLKHLFLTQEEQRLANETIYGRACNGEILGYGLEEGKNKSKKTNTRGIYVLYAGRIERGKGIEKLLKYFERFNQEYDRGLKLILIGKGLKEDKGLIEIPSNPMIKHLGFVNEAQKVTLMKNALVFIHPSSNESLGIALLEAFMYGTPGLVNVFSQVLTDHVQKLNAGLTYRSYKDFAFCLNYFLDEKEEYRSMKKNAKKYFKKKYSMNVFREKIFSVFNLDRIT